MVDGFRKAIKSYSGESPDTCPWHAFSDKLVIDILNGYAFYESGQLSEYWGNDPPYIMVEAMREYHMALERVKQKQILQDMENRKRNGNR